MDDFLNSTTCRIYCDLSLLEKLYEIIVTKTQNHEDYSRYSQNKGLEKLEECLFKIERFQGFGRSRYLYNTFKVRLKKAKKEGQKKLFIYENRLSILVNFADDTCKSWEDFVCKHDKTSNPLPKQIEKTPPRVASTFSQTFGSFSVHYIYLS